MRGYRYGNAWLLKILRMLCHASDSPVLSVRISRVGGAQVYWSILPPLPLHLLFPYLRFLPYALDGVGGSDGVN